MPAEDRDLVARIDAWAASRRFGARTVLRWRERPPADQAALLELAERLRLGENQFRDFFDHFDAVAMRRGTDLADVMADPEIEVILSRRRSRNQAIHDLRETLRRLRYPERTAIEQCLRRLARALDLPAGASVELPPDLQGGWVELRVRADDAESLRQAATRLAEAARAPEVEEMYRLLVGEW